MWKSVFYFILLFYYILKLFYFSLPILINWIILFSFSAIFLIFLISYFTFFLSLGKDLFTGAWVRVSLTRIPWYFFPSRTALCNTDLALYPAGFPPLGYPDECFLISKDPSPSDLIDKDACSPTAKIFPSIDWSIVPPITSYPFTDSSIHQARHTRCLTPLANPFFSSVLVKASLPQLDSLPKHNRRKKETETPHRQSWTITSTSSSAIQPTSDFPPIRVSENPVRLANSLCDAVISPTHRLVQVTPQPAHL